MFIDCQNCRCPKVLCLESLHSCLSGNATWDRNYKKSIVDRWRFILGPEVLTTDFITTSSGFQRG